MANMKVTSAILRAALGIVATIPAVSLAAESPSDDWQWAVTIYGWLPDITGDTHFPAAPGGPTDGPSIDISGGDILDALKFAFLSALEVRKGRWGVATDVIYLDMGATKSNTRNLSVGGNDLPASVTANADLDITSWVWTTVGTYRVIDQPAHSLELLAGARLLDVTQTLTWHFDGDIGPLPLPGRDGKSEVGDDLWDGIIGVRGRINFGTNRTWFVPYYLDVGTGDSDSTLQAMAGVGYVFSWGEIKAGWRYLDYDLEAPIESLTTSGPQIGATFRF